MNHKLTITVLFVLLVAIGSSSAAPLTLREYAPTYGVSFGAAVGADQLRNDPVYADTLAREFGMVTPENAMKFGSISSARGQYNFADADTIVNFAAQHNMAVRGHTLVWHQQQPAWLVNTAFARDEMTLILREWITTIAGRYRGRIAAWDVVNEAVESNGTLRQSLWLQRMGADYIDTAFRLAHEADPNAKLFYNDYGAEGLGAKSDGVYQLVRGMVERGVPIHGVGFQMHVSVNWYPSPQDIAANIARLYALGLEVQITEMDVQIQNGQGTMDERFNAQAQVYRDVMNVCLNAPNCTSFVTWGFTDRYSWIPQFTGNADAPLLFTEGYTPKPAYTSLIDILAANQPPAPLPAPTGPTVRVDVNPPIAQPGEQVEVQLNLFNMAGLYGLQTRCDVDPAVLQGTARADSDGFNNSNSFFVDSGFNTSNGQWLIAASRLQPNPAIDGNVIALKLGYQVIASGSSPINCGVVAVDINGREQPIAIIAGVYQSTLTPTTMEAAPIVSAQSPITAGLTGVAQYQNRPDNGGIHIEILLSDVVIAETLTQPDGTYQLADIPAGTYTLRTSAPYHLPLEQLVTVDSNGQLVDTGSQVLPAGDTDTNGIIDVMDATLVGANFDVQAPPAPENTDLNGDGVVNISDLVLVGSNFALTAP
jgi:endo-1,4-beta-xylanase